MNGVVLTSIQKFLLTLPWLHILETSSFFKFKCDLASGGDMNPYKTSSRDNYPAGRHRTLVFMSVYPLRQELILSRNVIKFISNAQGI